MKVRTWYLPRPTISSVDIAATPFAAIVLIASASVSPLVTEEPA
jgi:hypothetical protein